jgi:hypothetical protein
VRERIGNADLCACHICRRKPTLRSELDTFADCEGCGRRTCYICIRECEGLGLLESSRLSDVASQKMGVDGVYFSVVDGMEDMDNMTEGHDNQVNTGEPWESGRVPVHKSMICSRCCEERGTEGEIWCLGCLAA